MCTSWSKISICGSLRQSAGRHLPRPLGVERQHLRLVTVEDDRNLLEVEHDVGDVLDHPGIDENSCSTPSILIAVTAAPSIEESRQRRMALPMVVANPARTAGP